MHALAGSLTLNDHARNNFTDLAFEPGFAALDVSPSWSSRLA